MFLILGEEVFKKIKVLSGGEKSRVALAKVLISEANFLLLDEPTNHLDMQSVNILIQALQQYEGSYVVVSHDRYFVSHIANKIWYIEDHEVKEYPGSFDEYEEWYLNRPKEVAEQIETPKVKKTETKIEKSTSVLLNNEKQVQLLENKIVELEAKKENLEHEMAKVAQLGDLIELALKEKALIELNKEINQLTEQWEELLS